MINIAEFNAKMANIGYGVHRQMQYPPLVYHPYEIFTQSPLFPGYLIGNYGTVYDIERNIVLSQYMQRGKGYMHVSVKDKDGNYVNMAVHRLVMIAFDYRPDYEDMEVNHKNKCTWFNYYNPYDPEHSNLEWRTGLENIHHELTHGIGEGHRFENYDIYTDDQIRQVCQMVIAGYSNMEIAKTTGINPEKIKYVICDLKARRYRKDITKEFPDLPYTIPQIQHTETEVIQICELLSKGIPSVEVYNILTERGIPTSISFIGDIRNKTDKVSKWSYILDRYEFSHYSYLIFSEGTIRKICTLIKRGLIYDEVTKEMGFDLNQYNRRSLHEFYRRLKTNVHQRYQHITREYFP